MIINLEIKNIKVDQNKSLRLDKKMYLQNVNDLHAHHIILQMKKSIFIIIEILYDFLPIIL